MASVVMVTGVSSYLGANVARSLAARADIDRVLGVDVRLPAFPLGDAEFLRTDVRNPLLGRVMRQAGVETVVHFGTVPTTNSRSARTSARETNVIGTMQLLGVCQALPELRHLVLASTASVYGASSTSPAVVTEMAAVNPRSRSGHVRDAIEVESYVRAVAQRRPEVGVSILRLAHVFGTHTRGPMTNYLRTAVVPLPFGFDARLQALHEDDAVAAIVTAAGRAPVGTVNIAADGVLTVRQALRIGHRPWVDIPTTTGRALGAMMRWAGIVDVDHDHIDYLMFGRCLDTTKMREVMQFSPSMTTRETFEWFARHVWGVEPSRRSEATIVDSPELTRPPQDQTEVVEEEWM